MALRGLIVGLALFATLLSPAPVWAQDDEEIVVTGQPLEDIVRGFVGALSGAPPAEDQLARWDRSVCPGVFGLRDVQTAQRLIDRIALRAFALDLNVGEPGCRANIFIFFTDDPPVLAAELRTRIERVMNESNRSMLGRRELTAFVESPAPVRWWSIASTRSRLGLDILSDGAVRDLSSSRVRRQTRQDLSRIIIVVDSRLASNLRVGALGDYLAMVSMAQIDAEAETAGFSTILNLFNGGPNQLTEWDWAYLQGLYGATRAARSASQQENQIRRTMMDELEETEAGDP